MFIFYKNCHILFKVSPQNLIIYKFSSLYHILEEVGLELNIKVTSVENENSLNEKIKNLTNYLIITNKKYSGVSNQLILGNVPINIFKLVEKINIEFLKIQFNSQSEIKVNNYIIDLNSREMLINEKKLKLTEKEINTITYLSKSNKPVSIDELQEKVWSYQSDMETHTVETHIYRLRKKILDKFDDREFIISEKDGYQIK
tara:strand:+ start:3857 stop:4459 length:603 start_codon:yes stop_codon:yes gene_type:complete